MHIRILRGLAIALLFAGSILIVPVTAAPGSQTWYLDSDPHAVTGIIMEKSGDQSGQVSFRTSLFSPGGGTHLWLADHAAKTEVPILKNGKWTVNLHTNEGVYDLFLRERWDLISVSIGIYNTTTGFHAFNSVIKANDMNTFGGLGEWINIAIYAQTDDIVIEKGEHLGLMISSSLDSFTLYTDGGSYITTPQTDPGYPLTELDTLGLLVIGLATAGGIGMISRRKNTA